MNSRNRRRGRQASMKARLGIAAAVLAGGGAAGVALVASHNGPASTTTADPAGYVLNFHHTVSEQQALTSALNMWNSNQSGALAVLAQMAPMQNFSQFTWHHTQFAAQRGVVVAATRQFIVVKSANGKLELWSLNRWTKQKNITANPTGMVAMTGNNVAAHTAAITGNTAPMAATMAGSASLVNQLNAPVTKPVTITVNTGIETITITITGTTATVTPTSTGTTGMATTMATTTSTTAATAPAAKTVARGDLVLVAGVRSHGKLTAELILFSVPKKTTGTSTATVPSTATATPAVSASPTHF